MKKVLSALLTALVLGVCLAPMPAYALNPLQGTCAGEGSGSDACTSQGNGSNTVAGSNGILRKITLIISAAGGIAVSIMILVGAMQYVTSGGDPSRTATAKGTIVSGLVGLAIIALAESIISLILSKIG